MLDYPNVPSGYSYEDAQPLIESLTALQRRRFPHLAEDILQAAQLGCWEATRGQLVPLELITSAIKRSIADTIGDLAQAKLAATKETIDEQPYDPMPSSDWGERAGRAIRDFATLPAASIHFMQLHFRDEYTVADAARISGCSESEGKRLSKRYKPILATIRPSWLPPPA